MLFKRQRIFMGPTDYDPKRHSFLGFYSGAPSIDNQIWCALYYPGRQIQRVITARTSSRWNSLRTAILGPRIVGYIGGSIETSREGRPYLSLRCTAVQRGQQGQGLFRALLADLHAQAEEKAGKPINRITLMASGGASRTLYQRLGFVVDRNADFQEWGALMDLAVTGDIRALFAQWRMRPEPGQADRSAHSVLVPG